MNRIAKAVARLAVLLLALVAAVALLLASTIIGIGFVWLIFKQPSLSSEILVYSLVVLAPAALFGGLAVWHSSNPAELLAKFWNSLIQATKSCLRFVRGASGESPNKLARSLLKPSLYISPLLILLGWYSTVPPPQPVLEPHYVVSETDPDLLPVHLHVNFDNATMDETDNLTGRGTTLDAARKTAMQVTVDSLRKCGSGVEIKLYGFASEAPFFIDAPEKNNKWNVKVADRRARAVYEMLRGLAPGMTIQEPEPWDDYEEMKSKRNSKIPVPEGSDRDAFADRVVVIYLSKPGDCMVVECSSVKSGVTG